MKEALPVCKGFEELSKEWELVLDDGTGFFFSQAADHYVGFHRTSYGFRGILRPSTDGTAGPGVYVGNSPEAIASFSRIERMSRLLMVALPCDRDEIKVINRFSSEAEIVSEGARLVVWRDPLANRIGSVIMSGFKVWPKNTSWGNWIDSSTPIGTLAEID